MNTMKINKNTQGYVWMSDRTAPEVYDHDRECELALDEAANPFVNEAFLYDTQTRVSTYIRYADGKYTVTSRSMSEISEKEADELEFLSNRMGGRVFKFKQLWTAMDDERCAGMPVWTVSGMFFCGFKQKEK